MKPILVSACLLGTPCRYDGNSKPCAAVLALQKDYRLIPVCPEVLGGLPTPRTPSEICGDCVRMKNGQDVTQNYRAGAQKALEVACAEGCEIAILKEKSPSCGCGLIYSGVFDGRLILGDGITTALLKKNGISVWGETQIENEGLHLK
ncbi:MAG: DUF523 domain-containing protein [Clostridia bacterium]|nr:DUF523 domain-containing protein [Clostridia bacterium]